MEKCLIFSNGHPVGADDIAHLVVDKKETVDRETETIDEFIKKWAMKMIRDGNDSLLSDSTNHVARIIIEETLAFFNGNRSQTAKRLGISRPTLQKKIASFGIDPTRPDYTDK
jgi:DNA-binding NtrC family response regulator